MIKYLFIVINSLSLFIFGVFSEDNGITVTHTIPANIIAGEEVAIELKVNKGGMSGFAKLQLELPEGIEVKESEDKGANYSYNERIAKWVWAALPTESEIIVKITLISSVNTLGAKTIAAKYSYVENNVKQVVEMVPAEVNVLAPGSDINAVVSTTPPKDSTAVATNQTTNTNTEPQGNISATRQISAGTMDNEFLITIKIKKDGTKGFARFSDDIPEGLIVKSAKTDGGSFSVADGKIKFVWVNVPEKDELEISYLISGTMSNAVMLGGEYSYLEDNQSKKFKLPMETIAFQANQVAKNETKEPTQSENNQTQNPQENKTNDPETANPATVKSVEETVAQKLGENKIETIGEKNGGKLSYMVQIGAFNKVKSPLKRLQTKFKITETVKSEMREGFSKFMVGSHLEYREARDHRERVKNENQVKSAFVVAYNQGKRITVQEALMITNQKWFK